LRDVAAESDRDFYGDIGLDDILIRLLVAEALVTKTFPTEMLVAAMSMPPTEDSIKIFFAQFPKWVQFLERRARGHWEVSSNGINAFCSTLGFAARQLFGLMVNAQNKM
jgi:hypothetical protein